MKCYRTVKQCLPLAESATPLVTNIYGPVQVGLIILTFVQTVLISICKWPPVKLNGPTNEFAKHSKIGANLFVWVHSLTTTKTKPGKSRCRLLSMGQLVQS